MAAPAATIASLSAALIQRFPRKLVTAIEWSEGKAAAMVPKVGWTGKPTWGMTVGASPAGSQDFLIAQTNAASEVTALVQPSITTYQQDFGVATLEGRLIRAASNSEGTLFDNMVSQITGIQKDVMRSFSGKIYRNGFGKMSEISAGSTVGSPTISLKYPEDSVQFEVGMRIVLGQASSETAALRNAGASARITGVDFKAGTLTFAGNLTAEIAAAVAGDSIFRYGDRAAGAVTTRSCIAGFEAQFNATDVLHGVTRSTDSRLRGTVITNAGGTDEDNLIDALCEVDRFGGEVDWVYMNPTRWKNLAKLAMGRYRPTTLAGPIPGVGVKGVNLMTAQGQSVDIYPDRYCPVDRIFGIEKKSLQVFLAGDSTEIPTFLDHDGVGKVLRLASADGVESRVGYYAEAGENAPCHNFVITY